MNNNNKKQESQVEEKSGLFIFEAEDETYKEFSSYEEAQEFGKNFKKIEYKIVTPTGKEYKYNRKKSNPPAVYPACRQTGDEEIFGKKDVEDRKSWFVYRGGPYADPAGRGWSVGPDGFLVAKFSKENGWYGVPLSTRGLKVTAEYVVDVDKTTSNETADGVEVADEIGKDLEYVNVVFATGDKERGAIVPKRTLNGNDVDKSLAKAGATIPTQHESKIFGMLQEMLNDREFRKTKLERKTGTTKVGWIEENGEWEFVGPGHPDFVNTANTGVFSSKRGLEENWKKIMKMLLTDNPSLFVIHAFALSATLNTVVAHTNITPLMPLVGQRGKYKSTAISMLMTWVGDYDRGGAAPYTTGTATTAGLRDFLASNSHSFVCIDEMGMAIRSNKECALNRLTEFLNNGARIKFKTDPITWKNAIVCSSNNSVADYFINGDEQSKALASRMIELNIDETAIFDVIYDDDTFVDIESVLLKNYGHGIILYRDFVKRNYRKLKIEVFNKYKKDFKDIVSKGFLLSGDKVCINFERNGELLSRLPQIYAFVMTSISIVGEILEIDTKNAFERARNLFDIIIKKHEDETEQSEAYSMLVSYVATHKDKFRFEGCKYQEEDGVVASESRQQNYASVHNKDLREIFGEIRQEREMKSPDDFFGRLVLFKAGVKELQDKKIIEDVKNFWIQAKAQGWAVGDDENKADKKSNAYKFINNTHNRCPVFLLGQMAEKHEKTEEVKMPEDYTCSFDYSSYYREPARTYKKETDLELAVGEEKPKTIYDMGFEPNY
jgi:hypothetical protein